VSGVRVSVKYGWRERLTIYLDRVEVAALYRHALRRYSRADGWVRELRDSLGSGEREMIVEFTSGHREWAKSMARDLDAIGHREEAIEVDIWAHAIERERLEAQGKQLLDEAEALTGLES
jgi:hypothetical protein